MMGVSLVNIFNSKVVHNESEIDGSPIVAPEVRGGECMIVSCSVEVFGEDIVGNISILGKAIDTFPNFEIDPTVLCKITEVIFVDEFFRDVGEEETYIFTTIERISQVKKNYVEGDKLGA